MTVFAVKHFTLRRPDQDEPFLSLPANGLALGPGIYTLEGPNQSGKSTFLKALVGALPASIKREGKPIVEIDSVAHVFSSPRNAAESGLIGVFQDDRLIPSLTLRDQLVLRHGRLQFKQVVDYAKIVLYGIVVHPFVAMAEFLQIELLVKAFSWLRPKKIDWLESTEIENIASYFIGQLGYEPDDLLPMLPASLSGGRQAFAKIVATQIYFARDPKPKVLLLDEAFAGLQRDLWPKLLRIYRKWAIDQKAIIIAVTHNPAEIELWEPMQQFRIEKCELVAQRGLEGSILQPGIPRPVATFLSHRINREDGEAQLKSFIHRLIPARAPIAILVSPHCAALNAFSELRAAVNEVASGEPLVISLQVENGNLDFAGITPVLEQLILHLRTEAGILFVVGGGSTINTGAFISSILFRGLCRTFLLPTTILAVADVVVGSKTSIPLLGQETRNLPAPLNIKHSTGTYHNPYGAIIDPRYIDNLTVSECVIGFSEIIKHGLLQDAQLLDSALNFVLSQLVPRNLIDPLGQQQQSTDVALDFAEKTAALKADVLRIDPFERQYGRILLYGHLHAHCLERITMFRICHGVAVYLGMLIELRLNNEMELYAKIAPILSGPRQVWLEPLRDLDRELLEKVYISQNKVVHGDGAKFVTIAAGKAGSFSVDEMMKDKEMAGGVWDLSERDTLYSEYVAKRQREVDFAEIWNAISLTLTDVLNKKPEAARKIAS